MGKLPNVELAWVPGAKLTAYLLNPAHPDGGPKARFLLRFGFSVADPATLEAGLLRHVASHDVGAHRKTAFGDIITVVGSLGTPDGRNPIVRTVWIVPGEGMAPRFVTLIPNSKA